MSVTWPAKSKCFLKVASFMVGGRPLTKTRDVSIFHVSCVMVLFRECQEILIIKTDKRKKKEGKKMIRQLPR